MNATSYSIGGFISGFGGLAGIAGSSPITAFGLLNTPMILARCENGFSYSSFFAASISFLATVLG